MTNSTKPGKKGPTGPEGMPVDAPGNDGPALSPHAVSRMHRAEDDEQAMAGSPDYTDDRSVAHETPHEARREAEGWQQPPTTGRDEATRELHSSTPPKGTNPSHHTAKSDTAPPRGLGDGELMEQPDSAAEAQQPGPDDPGTDDER
jgi:hypothetical protein